MKRRNFIKNSLLSGISIGTAITAASPVNLIGLTRKWTDQDKYDLVAIKGGEPDEMFEKAIQSFGGMKSFIKPNQTVVVKPNIGWDVEPERAANTNPLLVKKIVKSCKEAGAKEVYVFDHTCDEWKYCYSHSRIEAAVEEAGGKIVPGNSERYYHDVEIKNGKRLKSAKVHELILESDVFINVPTLKHHGSTQVSLGMKNLMGIVWDRGYWHRNDLHQCIADFVTFKKPDLTIIDGYNVMKRNGPRGVSRSDVLNMKTQIISRDIVAADAAAVKIFGQEPEQIGHVRIAAEMNLGTFELDKLSINRLKI